MSELSSENSHVFKDADPPFGADAEYSDVIVRSSDAVDFHAHKVILAFASPFFKNMFAFPPPPPGLSGSNELRDGKPIVHLPESSHAVEKLLLICYPRAHGQHVFENLDGLGSAHEAAGKYLISGGREMLAACLLDPKFLGKEPLRVFAIACHRGLEDVAKAAARWSLRDPFLPPNGFLIPEFRLISAHTLAKLLGFWRDCIDAAKSATDLYYDPVDAFDFDDDWQWNSSTPSCSSVWWVYKGHTDICGMQDVSEDYGPGAEYLCPPACVLATRPEKMTALEAVLDFTHRGTLKDISNCSLCVDRAVNELRTVASDLSWKIEGNNTKFLDQTTFCD
ncbi:hypothetical protein C8J57DRAFT_1271228 [Mycena rebaudengoi]|nr:hypothetical protein C8J57DRAFT_1271228 [Mycena rebaudengoi]